MHPLCLHFHFCIKHFTGLMWRPDWCWRWKSLGVMGRLQVHTAHTLWCITGASVSQSYQVSYPKVATLVSPPLLHDCQSARCVSLWMLQLRRQLAGQRDKSSFHHFLFDNLSFPCDLDKRSMCSLIQGFLCFHKHILHKCRGYSHNETLLDESNILACAWSHDWCQVLVGCWGLWSAESCWQKHNAGLVSSFLFQLFFFP